MPVKAGAYNVLLGSVNNNLPAFNQYQHLWLQTEIWINGVDEVFGRRAMVSVAYARQAEVANGVADNCITSVKIINGTIIGSDIAPSTIGAGNIANGAIDTQLKAAWAPTVNGGVVYPKIITGSAVSTGGGTYNVTLAAGIFTSPPVVLVTAISNGSSTDKFFVNVQSISTTSFTVNTYASWTNMTQAAGISFYWMAIGN